MPHSTTPAMIPSPTHPLVHPSVSAASGFPPYIFRKRNERVDWRRIAAVDPDRIAREVDFKTLQDNVNNVTFCDVENELGSNERPLDPNYVKLFKLAQLIIEYLLNSQQYLTNVIGNQDEQLLVLKKESSDVSTELDKEKKELQRLKKECHKRKKLLAQQQQVIVAGGSGNYFSCPKCPKAFVNESFLQGHLERKHPDYRTKGDFDDLQRQLAEMKERYERTRRELEEERERGGEWKRNAAEREESERNLRNLLEEGRAADKEASQRQLDQFKAMFMDELKEIHEKLRTSQEMLTLEREKNNNNRGRGGVGNRIFDEEEMAQMQDLIGKQKREIDLLRAKLEERTGVEELESRMARMKADHQAEMENLRRDLTEKRSAAVAARPTTPMESHGDRGVQRNVNNRAVVVEKPKKIVKPEGKRATPDAKEDVPTAVKSAKRSKWDEAAHEAKMADVRSRMLNDDDFMGEVREECSHEVSTKLVDFGVQHNNNHAISENDFSRINKSIAVNQEDFAQKNPSFFQMRNLIKDRLDQRFRTCVSRRLTPTLRPDEPEVEPREVVKRIVPEEPAPPRNTRLEPSNPTLPNTGGGGVGPPGFKRPQLKATDGQAGKDEKEEEGALPAGTIPFIGHALPEMNLGPTSLLAPKSHNRSHVPHLLNSNNNNSNNDERNNVDGRRNELDGTSGIPPSVAPPMTKPDDYDDEEGDDEDEEDEGSEEEASDSRKRDEGQKMLPNEQSFRAVEIESTMPKPPPRNVGIRLPAAETEEVESVSEFDEEEDNDENDDDDDDDDDAPGGPRRSTAASSNIPSGNPRRVGKNVAELRDKIQEQLYKRDAKKPAGGVDVGAGEGEIVSRKAPVPAPRSSRQRKSSSGWEDDDDDEDSFTVSSLEGQSHGRGALRMPTSSSLAGASSTMTSSGDAGAASTSNWGSGATGFGSSGGGVSGSGPKPEGKKSIVDVVDWDSDY